MTTKSLLFDKALSLLNCGLILPVICLGRFKAISLLAIIFVIATILKAAHQHNWPMIHLPAVKQFYNIFYRKEVVNEKSAQQTSTTYPSVNPTQSKSYYLNSFDYNLLALMIAVYLFSPFVAITSFLVMIIGDNMAALIGQLYGKHFMGAYRKTWEGSAAMYVTSCLILYIMPFLYGNTPISFKITLIIAFIATFIEAAGEGTFKLDDNLSIVLLTGLILQLYA